ncbi:MAG: glutathione S-transferase family protein [Polyangiaceae bacterium]
MSASTRPPRERVARGPRMTLYSTTLSANGRKVMAVIRELDLEVEHEDVNVYRGEGQTPEYLALNPAGKVPTLVDGALVLWESNAILQYLSEAHASFALSSWDPQARADILRWLFWEAAHWQPALVRIMAERVGQLLFPDAVRPMPNVNWTDPGAETVLAALEDQLSRGRPFMVGSVPTLADFSLAGMTTYFGVCEFPIGAYPAIARWLGRMRELPSWRATQNPLWEPEGAAG